MANEVHDVCQYMSSISNGCSDGSQHNYDAHSFGELRLVRYRSTNTLPGTGKSGWLAQDHGTCNISLPKSELPVVIVCHSLPPVFTYTNTLPMLAHKKPKSPLLTFLLSTLTRMNTPYTPLIFPLRSKVVFISPIRVNSSFVVIIVLESDLEPALP